MDTLSVFLRIRVTPKMLEEIRRLAKAENRSLSNMALRMLRERLEQMREKEKEIK
jgi:hypothetical protein